MNASRHQACHAARLRDGPAVRAVLEFEVRFAWVLFAAIVAASATGCTSLGEYLKNGFKVGPNYRRPPAPVATDWIDAADVRVRKASEDLSRWWAVFHDPVLDSLVVNAFRQNITLREAGFRVMAARAQRAITVGTFFPQTQAVSGGYMRDVVRTNGTSFFNGGTFSSWNLGFNLAWELDFWGRFRRAIEAADADLDASIEGYDDVLVTLLGDVAATYVEMRTLEQQLEYVHANVKLQQQTLTLAEARLRGGQASELDTDQARSNLAQTKALLPQQRLQLREATNRLCILLGIPPEDLSRRLAPGPIPVGPPEATVGIPAELLARRPDLRRAERQVAAQSARIGVAMAELYPHISVSGSLLYLTQQPTNFFGHLFLGNMGPSLQWNILNYGRLLNNVRLQDARLQELIATYQNAVLTAAQEAENGIVVFLQSQERARFLIQSVEATERAVKLSLVQYGAGLVDFNRIALLEQNLVQQQNIQAQARGDIALGLVQLYRALGGGWQIRLAPPPGPALFPAPNSPAGPVEPVAPSETLPEQPPPREPSRLAPEPPRPPPAPK